MPQKTNLNISPYYDDFDKADNFYKVLFKPGFPVQARELTGLQSILQNQIENFGSHIFKEGSMVLPGSITYDSTYFSVKINPDHLGIDVSIYLDALINNNDGRGTTVIGQDSRIEATIKNYILPPEEGVDDITLFVKYKSSGTDGESKEFPNGEILVLDENVTYGNTTLNIGETILTLVSEEACTIGSAFGIDKGVYFIRGTFVDVEKELIVLEPYSNQPSYRVGLQISETVVSSNDEVSLNDNARGFTNYAAPGADRFKIVTKLAKKSLLDFEDTNFIELLRVREGEIKKLQNTSVYSEIEKYLAKRTYEESGNYAVDPFTVKVQNSLNDLVGSKGLYTEEEKTDSGNDPSEDLMCIKLSPGKAYVRGFGVDITGNKVLDVEKPRETKTLENKAVPFRMGSILQVNNAEGSPWINVGGSTSNIIGLYNQRKGSIPSNPNATSSASGDKIGEARVYSFAVTDSSYGGASTKWDLHMYDVQMYQRITLSKYNNISAPVSSKVRGLSSGATGYIADNPTGTVINVTQTTGTFIEGETLIFNEEQKSEKASVTDVISYNSSDILSVFQNSTALSSSLISFSADAVLHDRILANFSPSDALSVNNNGSSTTGRAARRRFSGQAGLKVGNIIAYSNSTNGASLETFHRVTAISSDGDVITLSGVEDVTGVCHGSVPSSSVTVVSPFRVKEPKIIDYNNSGLYSILPRNNVASVDLSNSTLVINKQLTSASTTASGTLTFSTGSFLDGASGISSAFFEPFDAERYSIHYTNGDIEPLDGSKVSITNGGNDITFTGLTQPSQACSVNVTLKKVGLRSRSKDYTRSVKVDVTRTVGVSTNAGLSTNKYYGLRVEDKEISLNVPDVVKVYAVYESKDNNPVTLDKLTFVSGLGLDTNSFVGEKLIGKNSKAVGQLVTRVAGGSEVEFVYLNANRFEKGESVTFKESGIVANLQNITSGNYSNRTDNYNLDKGHRKQFSDYSRLVRKEGSAAPSNRLLVIMDHYTSQTSNVGDVFTVNSYTKDRYTKDIPTVGDSRASDIIDFRPRVVPFGFTDRSPFFFTSRVFESDVPYVVAPNESSLVGLSFYLGRIDKLVINKFERAKLIKGVSAEDPLPPTDVGDSMEVAEITLPPYLYDPIFDPDIRLYDNRRFTMRDIGKLEKRIIDLENFTSLSALELDTKSLQVTDADGLDRFKTGFVVNDFKDHSFIDESVDGSRCDVDVDNKELISAVDTWSIKADLALDPAIDAVNADLNEDLKLLDPNTQKTGDLITLKYSEVASDIKSLQATTAVNVNPFEVTVFVGAVMLDPSTDNWTRTIYKNKNRSQSTGAKWAETSNIVSDKTKKKKKVKTSEKEVLADQDIFDGHHTEVKTTTKITRTRKQEFAFSSHLEGPQIEFDYVKKIKLDGKTDPFMRSRNVAFSANGLKPRTRHYPYLDSGVPDIFPKVFEIEMISGSFVKGEKIIVTDPTTGLRIGKAKLRAPNHKFRKDSKPARSGIVSGNVAEGANLLASERTDAQPQKYQVDIFDADRPAPSDAYSSTSKLLNINISNLANREKHSGYIVKGALVTGETSGATATVTNMDLMSDNWGDLLGTFFIRDANDVPEPPVLFYSGTKTFRLSAAPPGTVTLPGSTALASDAAGTYTATGVIQTLKTTTVNVRNPPPPPPRPNEIVTSVSVKRRSETELIEADERELELRRRGTSVRSFQGIRIEAPYRDPLAQSFRADETGMFLTSVDVYFARKDPKRKLFVELRDVELGLPTKYLVQDYAQVSVSPEDILVSDDASAVTNIRFPSPIYLEGGKEYALVFLCPSSDLYEMWCATMNEPTVKTSNLPDVETVIHAKQYTGGSLFKSQNGTIWTPSQEQDLTFQLYKAEFTTSGSVTFFNSPIEAGSENVQKLSDNPIRTLPRKLKVPVTNLSLTDAPVGRKLSTGAVSDAEDASITGIVEQVAAPLVTSNTPVIVSGGTGYTFTGVTGAGTANSVPLKSIEGDGTTTASITVDSAGKVTSITNLNAGSRFVVGDVITIDNDAAMVTSGAGARFSVKEISETLDTVYLTDVQGATFKQGDAIIHYGTNNDTRQLASNSAVVATDSEVVSDLYTGNVLEIIQPNHAHHANNNVVRLEDIKPDSIVTQTTGNLTAGATKVSVASTSPFINYAGISSDRGEALIGTEIVEYIVGTGELSLSARGLKGSTDSTHSVGSDIQTYQLNGFPLIGINTTANLPTNQTLRNATNVDNYFLEIGRGSGPRSENITDNKTLLCFQSEKAVGGKNASISQNHQFSSFIPEFNVITPGSGTFAAAQVRTISGTSAGGNEISFIDQGFEPTLLNEVTFFSTPRMVASVDNEAERLDNLPKNKSLSLKVDMVTDDKNLSPVLDVQNATFILNRNKINSPVADYTQDIRPTTLDEDPHGSIFISNKVNLQQPATSLKVFVAANVQAEADFRVYYRLFSSSSSEVSENYRLFPGHKNMLDTNGDGFGDQVIDPAMNDGTADALVKKNGEDDFSEYQFTIDGLERFDGFTIKIVMSSTNECVPIRLRDFRAIALA